MRLLLHSNTLISQNSLLLVLVFVYDNNIKELFQPYHLRLKSFNYYPTVIYRPFTFYNPPVFHLLRA